MKKNIYYLFNISFMLTMLSYSTVVLNSQSRLSKISNSFESNTRTKVSPPGENSINKNKLKFLSNFNKENIDSFIETDIYVKRFRGKFEKQNFNSTAVVDSFVALTTLRFGSDKKEKYSYLYNSEGNWVTSYIEILEDDLWVNQERKTFLYNVDGNILSELSEKWSFNKWNVSWKVTYSYDSEGNIASTINEIALGFPATLDKDFKQTITYDSEGNQTTNLTEKWDGNQWIKFSKNSLIYDINKNLTSMLTEIWDGSQWLNYFNNTFTYDANGNSISLIEEFWQLGVWNNLSRYINVYDSNGNKISITREQWLVDWSNISKINFSYDLNGNLISKLNEQWTQAQWENDSRQTYEYDSSQNMIHAFSELWLNTNWDPEPSILFFEDKLNGYTIDATEINVYYSTITTDILESDKIISDFSLSQNYPNPFNPTTTIIFELLQKSNIKLNVYNTLGEQVATLVNGVKNTGNHKVSWDASNMPSGIYIYKLQIGDKIFSNKMILMK